MRKVEDKILPAACVVNGKLLSRSLMGPKTKVLRRIGSTSVLSKAW